MPARAAIPKAFKILDAAGAALVGVTTLLQLLASGRRAQAGSDAGSRKLLTLEADYSFETIRTRGLEQIVASSDLEGFFDHVWIVNPTVGADPIDVPRQLIGRPIQHECSPRHTFIEGPIAFSRRLRRFPMLNFVLAQRALMRSLRQLVVTERVSVIRASEPFILGLLGLGLARSMRLPLVVRLISNYDGAFWGADAIHPRLFRRRWLEKRIERFVLRRADLVAAGNEDIRGYAIANGADPQKLTVFLVGNLIEEVHFSSEPAARPSVAAELGLDGRPFLICVTRLDPIKHPEDALRAFALAAREVAGLAGVFVGDGPMRDELIELAAQLGVHRDVVFTGNREQLWVASALTSASVVLSPLTGRALVEAALSATPIVAYDVDWQSELVVDGETGRLVAYRDVEAMAAAVVELLSNPITAHKLGETARASARASMDPAALAEHERKAYVDLIGGRSASAASHGA